MEKTWHDAIVRVLREAQVPLHYSDITDKILAQGYYETDGATPHSTVNAQITASIKLRRALSPYVKTGRGIYGLRELLDHPPAPEAAPIVPETQSASTVTEAAVDDSESVVRAFGMYWQRELVVWKGEPRIFGKQQAAAKAVDFCKQLGIYILYDHHTVVYVGRSIDRPMGRRLYEHTIDRLGSRWNRFSWFGLLDVADDGKLHEVPIAPTLAAMIATMEALLIEALEPPQNRKRGDDFSGVEYIQDADPELREREIQNTLRQIEQRMRGVS